jgi:protein TonB
MIEAVTDIIVARSRQIDRLSVMLMWSVGAHVALSVLLVLIPEPASEPPPRVMMISLGGAPGPRTGGMTQVGGQPVQSVAPEEPVRRVETPPAPKPPEMTLPDPKTKPRPQPKPQQAPKDATGKTPTAGEKPEEGSTTAQTQVRGQGFGLSSGGGGGPGVRLDSDFCCPEYVEQMVRLIQTNWRQAPALIGRTTMKFTILRDGTIADLQVEKSSGFRQLDLEAQRAVLATRKLPPLPAGYTNPALGVHLDFVDE